MHHRYQVTRGSIRLLAKLLRQCLVLPRLLLWLLLGFLLVPTSSWAGEADVRLVIDISGSMKRNDPQNLRQPAVNLLMELLPDGSHAGVWTFGKEVNMLVPFGEVDSQWREMATQKAGEINSVGLYTNIGGALEKATAVTPTSQGKAHIILLTDGMVDIDKDPLVNQKEWRRIVDKILPLVKDQGFSIHTIALSDHADTELMKKLSRATDGHSGTAKTADELMPEFLKAFDAAAPSQQLPLLGNRFVVDSSVEEFTALMFRGNPAESIALIGPDNEPVHHGDLSADVSWHHTDGYDLVTVTRPLEGEWQVSGKLAAGSRITVVSDLNLRVKPLPINAPVGSVLELQLALQEDNKIITRKDFLNILSIQAKSTYSGSIDPSWMHNMDTNSPPSNGVFSASMDGFKKPGEYLIKVELDGKSFQRGFSHQLLISMPFEAELKKGYNDNSQREYRVIIRKNAEHIQPNNTQMALSLLTPDRRKHVYPLEINEKDTWEYAILPQQEGQYQLQVKVTGVDDRGEVFEYTLNDLDFKNTPGDDFASMLGEPEVATPKEDVASSVASSVSASSAPAEPSPEEEVAVAEESSELLFYIGLGVGNLLLLGIGIFAFRKILGATSESPENATDEQPEPAVAEEDTSAEEEPEIDPGTMEMEEIDDEIPPMEDLEPDMDFEEDDIEEPEVQSEAMPETEDLQVEEPREPEVERIDEDFDFDLSALDSEAGDDDTFAVSPQAEQSEPQEPEIEDELPSDTVTEPEIEAAEEEPEEEPEEEDMAQAMLKAQGLDLAEDELDDAISNLIDELDDDAEEPTKKPDSNMAGEINLDDFDFDDDDDK
ncbi:VWA domain-containing protein [Marinagarivorans cellulosilyticus]|uniref:VWFA domain-containing protein n=1 Tax=Marinagarivorans cellulosilyticus TaxID=2721545 RepID=A0AAN2BJ96_9GAMM|nr:vWA domain-containing protein [Marinagarivorans cellulosilyticus]BCD96780.1 hypothetical protein MARGE09_P0980 [Marinagarivorans cellulosilyticus]